MHLPSLTDEELRALAKRCQRHDGVTQFEIEKRDLLAMIEEIQGARTPRDPATVAAYIVEWLEVRNGAALAPALDAQTVGDRRTMLEELTSILIHRGRPPNWIKR